MIKKTTELKFKIYIFFKEAKYKKKTFTLFNGNVIVMLMNAAPPPETYSTQSGPWTRASCDDDEYDIDVVVTDIEAVVADIEAVVADIGIDEDVDASDKVVGRNCLGVPSKVCGHRGPMQFPLLPVFSIAEVHILHEA